MANGSLSNLGSVPEEWGSPAPAGLGHLCVAQLRHVAGAENGMQIEKHDKSYIVKLEAGSSWRIWPGDIALTLGWSHVTVLEVSEIDDEFCSHALIDKADGSRVRVIEASKDWPAQQVRQSFKKG